MTFDERFVVHRVVAEALRAPGRTAEAHAPLNVSFHSADYKCFGPLNFGGDVTTCVPRTALKLIS